MPGRHLWSLFVGYYEQALPHSFQQLQFSISSVECFNLLVGTRRWIQSWRGKVVLLFSDNWAAVCAANSGRASDPLIRASIRELWWLCGEPSDLVATPLLRTTAHPRGRTISASMLTRSIREVINAAGLSHLGYTPHSFRRGGASCSHHDGAPMEAIKFHGTWSSDAVHQYLLAPPEFKSPIRKAFKARFN